MIKKTLKIRPEQAQFISALEADVIRATRAKDAAIKAALVGMIDGPAQVSNIEDDGTVTMLVPEEEEEEAHA